MCQVWLAEKMPCGCCPRRAVGQSWCTVLCAACVAASMVVAVLYVHVTSFTSCCFADVTPDGAPLCQRITSAPRTRHVPSASNVASRDRGPLRGNRLSSGWSRRCDEDACPGYGREYDSCGHARRVLVRVAPKSVGAGVGVGSGAGTGTGIGAGVLSPPMLPPGALGRPVVVSETAVAGTTAATAAADDFDVRVCG